VISTPAFYVGGPDFKPRKLAILTELVRGFPQKPIVGFYLKLGHGLLLSITFTTHYLVLITNDAESVLLKISLNGS
jgi:hypothetical protein